MQKRERLRVSQIYREVCAALGAWGLTYWRTPWWGSMTLTTLVRTTSFIFSTKFCLAYSTCMDEPRLMTATAGMRIINKNARKIMMPSTAAGESAMQGQRRRVQQTMLIRQLKNRGTSPLPGLLSPHLAACCTGMPSGIAGDRTQLSFRCWVRGLVEPIYFYKFYKNPLHISSWERDNGEGREDAGAGEYNTF